MNDNKKTGDTDNNTELAAFRNQIDEIDDKIIKLLVERIEVVKQVGALKEKTSAIPCPIRSGREAKMIRRIVDKLRPTDFPTSSAASIWRTIIGASTGVESPLILSVFSNEKENNIYWLAREYFGSNAPIIKQPHINRIVGDVMDGKATVGIVPFLRSADTSNWWTVLLQHGDNVPKIFAHVPFVYTDVPGKAIPSALALAKLIPEPSGDDMSLVVIEADANVSQHRLQTAFVSAKLDVAWINIATLSPASRHHLVEIKGFITPEHEDFTALLSGLGTSVLKTYFLGAYATPMTIANSSNS